MSDLDKDRSHGGGGGFKGGNEENDGGGSGGKTDQGKHGRKGKKVALFRFRKVKKRKPINSAANSGGCFGKNAGGGGGCGLCFKPSPTVDSAVESPASDPNNSEFGFDLLRALIEKNDFYSEECNTHLDLDGASTCNAIDKYTCFDFLLDLGTVELHDVFGHDGATMYMKRIPLPTCTTPKIETYLSPVITEFGGIAKGSTNMKVKNPAYIPVHTGRRFCDTTPGIKSSKPEALIPEAVGSIRRKHREKASIPTREP
ncbi:hypothetical protein RJ640_008754 [Escallonia rubra]|uniref:Uncharacterized protein n=1 Tax=Escallonia rubra TaxID=112253 RepID=A0AA88QGS2_9ASTE|nr:hypothetical protein RJ640_008754 [Escallonia rubra]